MNTSEPSPTEASTSTAPAPPAPAVAPAPSAPVVEAGPAPVVEPVSVEAQDQEALELLAAAADQASPSPDGAIAEPATAEPVEPAPFDPASWASFDDVKPEGVPEAARPYVDRALSLARERMDASELRFRQDIDHAAVGYQEARQKFEQLIEQLDNGSPDGIKRVTEALTTAQRQLETVSNEHITVLWEAFNGRHPEYKSVPPAVREGFASLLRGDGLDRFNGTNPLERLEEAYRYACFKAGHNPTQPAGAQPAAVARAQATISTGTAAPNRPTPKLDDLSYEELMRRDLRLLQGGAEG